MYVKLEKSEFHVARTTFLGFDITLPGISMDPARITTSTLWTMIIKELQRFLGFSNFY